MCARDAVASGSKGFIGMGLLDLKWPLIYPNIKAQIRNLRHYGPYSILCVKMRMGNLRV